MIIGQPMQSNHTIRAPIVVNARAIGKLPWLLAYILLFCLLRTTLGALLDIESPHVGFFSRSWCLSHGIDYYQRANLARKHNESKTRPNSLRLRTRRWHDGFP
ncbi:hypothetical protein GGS26DRAFT_175795 [Hypomontagnella submonticulosa]|nr:hypothetical protein GGS26DRAFT_175795 [Hypomontagnella submonticulosa]